MSVMTVKRLISALKKMPADAKVCFAAHDQDWEAGEFDGSVNNVALASEALNERRFGVVLS